MYYTVISTCLSVRPSIRLYVCLSVRVSTCPLVYTLIDHWEIGNGYTHRLHYEEESESILFISLSTHTHTNTCCYTSLTKQISCHTSILSTLIFIVIRTHVRITHSHPTPGRGRKREWEELTITPLCLLTIPVTNIPIKYIHILLIHTQR